MYNDVCRTDTTVAVDTTFSWAMINFWTIQTLARLDAGCLKPTQCRVVSTCFYVCYRWNTNRWNIKSNGKSNQVEIICDTKQNINKCDMITRPNVSTGHTQAVPAALTGVLGSKNTNYNSKWRQHYNAKLSLASMCLKQATVGEITI